MTSVSLNLPGPTIQDQTHLFISPDNHQSTLSCYSFFDILDQSQAKDIRCFRHGHQEFVFHGRSSDNQQVCNASSTQPKSVMADPNSGASGHLAEEEIEEEENRRGNYEYEKLLSSNVSLTRKMMRPPSNNLTTKKAFDIIRVCADCNTTSTPLWRSGPNGPKSLCNACGIRQRKARRAMAEAANSSVDSKSRVHHLKEKKCRRNHFAGLKNKSKTGRGTLSEEQKVRIDLKDFSISLRDDSSLKQEFPMDEVAQAAMLLMDLSRGFLYL
ncbi:putative GATA transcription factor 22 isoform X2 [Vigna radiata var. radiata]|uniref:GATA transcription factor 22 isoform X2 n=1 Tax=Vigna radiata var. radiata TaxID=3916 RepID=A0A1S3U3M2_VIGRR|nr:putative GATA transcription factor 22 isoform X2 [Vigna radiata var. radiata]